ncbi:Serine/threonine-protein phosphatase 7 long form [Glycine soja]
MMGFNMASSSSFNHYDVASGPLEDDLLWMQKNHISQHIWNGLYPIMKLAHLKVNGTLVNAFIEMWRPKTHTFHLKCGEATITLQDVSVLLGISMDGRPLTSNTNINWFELCHELLVGWLLNLKIFMILQATNKGLKYLLILGSQDSYEGKRVPMRYLQFLRDLRECSTYAWGAALLGNLYIEMCIATDYNVKSTGGFTLLIQLWAWERCPTLAPLFIPPQQQNAPLAYRWLGGEFHHIGNDNLLDFRRKLDVMKRDEFVWIPYSGHVEMNLSQVGFIGSGKEGKNLMRLMQPALNGWNSRYERRVEQTPPQTGTLSLNSEYMRWYKRKTKVYVDPKHARRRLLGEIAETLYFMVSPIGRRVCTFDDLLACIENITLLYDEEDRILEAHEDAPPSQPQFEHQQFNILQRSVETRGLARRRETVDAAPYSLPPMPE